MRIDVMSVSREHICSLSANNTNNACLIRACRTPHRFKYVMLSAHLNGKWVLSKIGSLPQFSINEQCNIL